MKTLRQSLFPSPHFGGSRKGAFLLLLLTLLTACTSAPRWRIGVSQCSDDDWRDKVNAEIRREAMFHPEIEVVIVSADDDSERQVEDIRRFAREGFDLIIAAPNEAEALTPVIGEVYEAGTPVIIFDRRINGKSYTAFVGADNLAIGANAAAYAHSIKGGDCRVIEICGLTGSTPAIARRDGFDTKAAELGMTIVGEGDGQWNRPVAAVVTDSLLRAHPEANVIFAHNDHMAIAAGEVARHMHRHDILVIGVDAAPTVGMQAVMDGKIDATFLYPTEGYTLVRTALDILQERPYKRENIVGIPSAVNSSNAEMLLMQNQLMEEETGKIERLQASLATYWREHSIQTAALWGAVATAILLLAILAYIFYMARVKARQQGEIQYQRDELHDLHSVISELQDALQSGAPEAAAETAAASQPATADTPDDTIVRDFYAIIDHQLGNSSLSIEDIAAALKLSRVQLYRRIKTATAHSPVELIRMRRLVAADKMIREGRGTIADIAYSVGFTSPSYFTKCYHEHFKRLPTDCLRK
ncbi:MAG: substrate-binding domain-containing protein [Bacteroidaceae bacterium]|nr:substrate-binding domain-containing protein [Bacteroidaceae bacterium]